MTAAPASPAGRPVRRCLVVDASVVLKWQLEDEQEVEKALLLRDDFLIHDALELSAPHLLTYELINGIVSAVKRARLSKRYAEQALSNLLACEFNLQGPPPDRVLALALQFGLSAYDSAYVALAEALGARFWTGDRPLYEAIAKRLPWVSWIGDYGV